MDLVKETQRRVHEDSRGGLMTDWRRSAYRGRNQVR